MYLNERTAGQENLPDQTNRAYPSVYPRKEKKLIKNNTQFQEIKFSIGSKDMLISYSEYNYSPSETTLWTVIAWRDGKIWPTVASAARGTWRWKRKTAPITFAVSLKVKITVLLDIPVFPLSSHVMMGNRRNLLDQSDLHFCICIICISRACSRLR